MMATRSASLPSLTDQLHPALRTWFFARFPAFSEIQQRALRHTLAGENVLILAPTGSGKTLAAFLSVLSTLGHEADAGTLPNALRAVYVSPLKALGNDIHRNLDTPLAALNEALPALRRIRMEVRTGDTSQSERQRQQKSRPHLLITTPESLASLISQRGFAEGLQAGVVIVDEIHAFAEGKRGSLLALTLERLEARVGRPLQRIGLSATAWPEQEVAQLLCGVRPCAIASVDIRRSHKLEILAPPNPRTLPAAGHNPYRVAHLVADRVRAASTSLVFTITRSNAERIGLALQLLLPEYEQQIAVHHSSVDLAHRLEIEQRLASNEMKAVAASASLELGVDFSGVDQVLLIGAPHGISSALQRLGRSGHRVNGVAAGALIPTSLPDLLQCLAVERAAREGRMDHLRIPSNALDVLAQALLGMSIEREWEIGEAFDLVRRAGPYLQLPEADFQAVLEYLAGGGRVLGPYGSYGKILVENGRFRVASRTVARSYYMNIGTISDEYMVRVMLRGAKKLGEVNEGFLGSLQPGEAFVIGGTPVRVKQLHRNVAIVEKARGERIRAPRWTGNKMPLSIRLAGEELALRRDLRSVWESGGAEACQHMLAGQWNAAPATIAGIVHLVARQMQAAPLPIDDPVQVELLPHGRGLLYFFHVVAGRAVNHSLAWVAARRLGADGSVIANFDDHGFYLQMDARQRCSAGELRAAFSPENWMDDLRAAIASSEALGRDFRPVAEVGQLLPKQTSRGRTSPKAATWNGALLYSTLLKYEPGHPLMRETVRTFLEDKMMADLALEEAARIHACRWEVYELPRPSPFALPLYAAFNAQVLLAQDREKALDDIVENLFNEWADPGVELPTN
ncbi:MAG: DEAD/DEAH box helicase [Bryobacterales bacterium]|nr:DEAD/DEAH box helicase [Bryobacterales bacterium]